MAIAVEHGVVVPTTRPAPASDDSAPPRPAFRPSPCVTPTPRAADTEDADTEDAGAGAGAEDPVPVLVYASGPASMSGSMLSMSGPASGPRR
jgi:hypothetical protein